MYLQTYSHIVINSGTTSDHFDEKIKTYIIVSMLCTLFIFLRPVYLVIIGIRAGIRIHNNVVSSLTRASINQYFDVTPTGRILNRLTKDL